MFSDDRRSEEIEVEEIEVEVFDSLDVMDTI